MNKKPKKSPKAKQLNLKQNQLELIDPVNIQTGNVFEPLLDHVNKYIAVDYNTVRKNKNRLYSGKGVGRYNIFKSFQYAGSGLYWAFINEPNIRIQITIGLFFFGLNVYFNQLNLALANLIFMAMTCSFEISNTVVENICDYMEKSYRPEIKIIKDMAAGAVFVVSLVWLVIILFSLVKIGLILAGFNSLFGIVF
jgi:diacylglycerol kinase